ncbi:MAG TPA: hypothetical protein VH306_04010 [Gaiellaceae bacterium]|jgi:hypothetical protein
MLWFTIWFLVILKIPVAYLAYVLWWAVKDPPEPRPEEPARVLAPTDGPDPAGARWRRRLLPRPRHTGPHGSPVRGAPRTAYARGNEKVPS